MRAIGGVLAQTLLVLALGVALGFGANACRKHKIELTKPYILPPAPPAQAAKFELDFGQAKAAHDDPRTAACVFLFVDARRGPDDYANGHIPGAMHFDHYEPGPAIECVVPLALQAEKVIIYCNGGDCEDSHYVREDLIKLYGVPEERVFVFKGGWEEWTKNNGPAAVGQE